MLNNKVYVILTLFVSNSLWVAALPTNITEEPYIEDGGLMDVECPENEFFNIEEGACELSCETLLHPKYCTDDTSLTCMCIDGYLRNAAGKCVVVNKCIGEILSAIETEPFPPELRNDEIITEAFTRLTNGFLNDTVNATSPSNDLNIGTSIKSLSYSEALAEYFQNLKIEWRKVFGNDEHLNNVIEKLGLSLNSEYNNVDDYADEMDVINVRVN